MNINKIGDFLIGIMGIAFLVMLIAAICGFKEVVAIILIASVFIIPIGLALRTHNEKN